MSTTTGLFNSRIGYANDVQRSLAPSRFVLTLIVFAMIAALVEVVSFQSSLEQEAGPNPNVFLMEVAKAPLFYEAYAIQLVLGLTAGVVAMISTDFRKVDRTYLSRFGLLIGAAILMTARSYTLADLQSTKLVDATGPFPFFFFVLVFVGANRNNWRVLEYVFLAEAWIVSALVMIGITKLRVLSRFEAVIVLATYLNILLWPAAWVLLRRYDQQPFLRPLRFGPILVYTLGSIFVQTRLNFVMILTVLVLHAYVQKRRGVRLGTAYVLWTALAVWLVLFTAIFLRDSSVFQKLADVAGAFYSRLDEDTRTGQLAAFARDVRPGELLLGRGSFATWKWGSTVWKGGTDVGYLSLLLYGGLPLLIAYIGAQVLPSLRVFKRDIEDWQLSSAAVVFMFTVRMFSSSYPGENLESYALLLCTGACIARRTPQALGQVTHVTPYSG